MAKQPKWVSPVRQNGLVAIFSRSKGFCVFGHQKCTIPEHHYEIYIDNLIKDWIASDRQSTLAEYQFEHDLRHRVIQRNNPLRGKFTGVSSDIYHDSQPMFFVEALGVSGLTHKPFAKVRLASSQQIVWVNISDALKPLSKHARRKALRYGKKSNDVDLAISHVCNHAVKVALNW